MTHVIRDAVLRITEMEGCADVTVSPSLESPHIGIIQDEDDFSDIVELDRDGAKALGEFLIEWSRPKGEVS